MKINWKNSDGKERISTRFGRILWISAKRFADDDNGQRAVALTYYTIFAIVPVAALLFGIAKGFDLDDRLRSELSQRLWQHQELLGWVCKFADTTLKEARGGIVAGVGVIALIWTVLWLVSNIEKAFNDVWELPTRKNIFRRFSDYLSIILLTPLILVVVGGAGVLARTFFLGLEKNLPDFSGIPSVTLSICSDLSPLVISCVIFTAIYRLAPNTRVRFAPALLAGVVAGILFQILQDGFLYLQGHIFRYNHIYGSFAALPLFLIWMQWSWQVTLFGAEIGFVAQNLDTGIFDREGNARESLRLRRVDELAAAAIVYRNFAAGQGATCWGEIAAKLNRPSVHLESEIAELLDAGILFLTEGDDGGRALLPGRPCDRFTAADALEALEASGHGTALADNDPLAPYNRLLSGFNEDMRSGKSNRLLTEL